MKILIADDVFITRRLMTMYVTQWGHQVVTANNGNDAWNVLRQPDTPRLVILNWIIPGINGMELCRKARLLDHGKFLHIIAFMAIDAGDTMRSALQAGADDFISKQLDIGEFHSRLQVGERMAILKAELSERVAELEEVLSQIKTLHGVLRICIHCRRIRNEKEAWQNLEKYIADHSGVTFSHGLCPDCMKEHYRRS